MILSEIQKKLIQAQKARDAFMVSVLRFLISAVKNREIELRSEEAELNDEEILRVIRKQIKQRNKSIESYKAGNRDDLVKKESDELEILESLLNEFQS